MAFRWTLRYIAHGRSTMRKLSIGLLAAIAFVGTTAGAPAFATTSKHHTHHKAAAKSAPVQAAEDSGECKTGGSKCGSGCCYTPMGKCCKSKKDMCCK